MKKLESEILKKGSFLYNDIIPTSVVILKQNWDYFYEEGYDFESNDLDENGFAFYVIYGEYDDILNANRSRTCFSELEAIQLAEETIKSNIVWE